MISKLKNFLTPRRVLGLLLLVSFLKGLTWSILVPPLQANDEDQHFAYAQEIVRQRTWLISPSAEMPEERALLWNLSSPIRLSYQRETIDLSPVGLAEIKSLRSRIFSPAARANLVPAMLGAGSVHLHPPIYYALEAGVHQLGAQRNILVRLEWMRLFSVLLGLATLGCVYGAGRELFPERKWLPLVLAICTSFHPLFTFFTSVVTNSALEYLCFALVAWALCAIFSRGMTWRRGLWLGAAFGAGLLSRASFVSAVLPVAAIFFIDAWHARRKLNGMGWTLAVVTTLVVAGWWYLAAYTNSREARGYVTINSADATLPALGARPTPPSLYGYLQFYPWFTQYRAFLNEWWGAFGWRDTFYPEALYLLLQIFSMACAASAVWLGLRFFSARLGRRDAKATREMLLIVLGVLVTLAHVIFYNGLDFVAYTNGNGFKIVGRYFLEPFALQMPAIVIVWAQYQRRWILPALCAGMIALNLYALFGVIVPRYYGEQLVVRSEPTVNSVPLASDSALSRSVSFSGELSRVDVWLFKNEPGAESVLKYTPNDKTSSEILINSTQMIFPYPTILRPPRATATEHRIELRGKSAFVVLASDGQLALKAYRPVSLSEILDRIVMLQPDSISHNLVLAMIAAYLLALGAFGAAGVISIWDGA